jgi:hypothetical protein
VKKLDHLMYRLELVKELLELHGKALDSSCTGRPSKTPSPNRLTARHFIERISSTEKKSNPTKRCAVCKKMGRKLHSGAKIVKWGCALRTASKYTTEKQILVSKFLNTKSDQDKTEYKKRCAIVKNLKKLHRENWDKYVSNTKYDNQSPTTGMQNNAAFK